jgi:hypothetical protein
MTVFAPVTGAADDSSIVAIASEATAAIAICIFTRDALLLDSFSVLAGPFVIAPDATIGTVIDERYHYVPSLRCSLDILTLHG